jgi:hypothetical protein
VFLAALISQAAAQCPPPLSVTKLGNQIEVSWPTLATLQTSGSVSGPWANVTNGFGPILLPLTDASAFFRLAGGLQNASREALLFYSSGSGAAAVGLVVSNQYVNHASYGGGAFQTGWSQMAQIPGPGGSILFYNSSAGTGIYGALSANRLLTYYTITGFSPWDHLEGFVLNGSSELLFYNSTNGNAAWDGQYPTLSPGYTHILRLRHSELLLFYKAGDGSGMLNFGPSVHNFAPGALPIGATAVATFPRAAGGDYVLFYRRSNGGGVFGRIDANGFVPTIIYGTGSFSPWSQVVGLDSSNFLFYEASTGAAAITRVTSDTNLTTVTSYGAGSFSTGWTSILRGELDTTMQGYCWPQSAPPGGTIDFFSSTGADSYNLSFVRLHNQDPALVDFNTVEQSHELVEEEICGPYLASGRMQNTAHLPSEGATDWARSFRLVVPDWPSGIYAAKLLDLSGSVAYVPFVVRAAPGHETNLLVIANNSTWNCYNGWGGFSRYGVPGDGAWQFSYLRPDPYLVNLSNSTGGFHYTSKHRARGELWVLNWLQSAGYQVDVATDLDLHTGIAGLNNYKGIILSTHPEYLSLTTFNNINNYLAAGGHLIYLGGNGVYDAVDISADLKSLTVYGTYGTGRTHLFRQLSPPHPESALLGVAYPWSLACGGDAANLAGSRVPYQVIDASHPFFAGTGMTNGALFGAMGWCVDENGSSLLDGGASGWEVDVQDANSPANVQLLALGTNPFTLNCSPYPNIPMAANMTYYEHPGGGFVFSVGSMSFGGSLVVDATIQQIMRNVLTACLQ